MAMIPSLLLKQLYTFASLKNTGDGIRFSLKNRLSDAKVTDFLGLSINGKSISLDNIVLDLGGGNTLTPKDVAKGSIDFPLKKTLEISVEMPELEIGKHSLEITFQAKPFGKLKIKVEDAISETDENRVVIPRDNEDDYSEAAIKERQEFVEQFTGAKLNHTRQYSFDAHVTEGNCEHFSGVAQIPLGFAGPLTVHGEHARGDFLIPMATSEGTLVASYNRGIKLLNLSGGVKCTIVGDAMQRAPVFVFGDARGARDFVNWVKSPENFAKIKSEAEATSSIAKLKEIDCYLAGKFAYLRFNYTTGDAAGQNMVGRATFAACSWVLDNYKGIVHFYLESNLATDKKASQVNVMRTRGKRVIAEATIPREVLQQTMRVDTRGLAYHYNVANVGSILSGANNNGLHSANAITAIFIATGQDVANVSESSAGILYLELTPEENLYVSITIPSLIVATYGGGTGLPTQRECLELLDCYGKNRVHKFAEIVAGTVLAGEMSLASAISSSDWVSSHEQYGRNR